MHVVYEGTSDCLTERFVRSDIYQKYSGPWIMESFQNWGKFQNRVYILLNCFNEPLWLVMQSFNCLGTFHVRARTKSMIWLSNFLQFFMEPRSNFSIRDGSEGCPIFDSRTFDSGHLTPGQLTPDIWFQTFDSRTIDSGHLTPDK